MAGTRMWLGRSCPSWTMSSARSVSQAAMPAARSAFVHVDLRVAIDLTFTTLVRPCADELDDDLVCLGGVAGPVDVTACRGHRGLELEELSRCRFGAVPIAAPATRSSLPAVDLGDDPPRLARMTPVAWRRFLRSWVLPRAPWRRREARHTEWWCPRAARGAGQRTGSSTAPSGLGEIRQVDRLNAATHPVEQSTDVHEARVVPATR